MKRVVKIWISSIMIALCLGGFVGCRKDEEGVIPHGVYLLQDFATPNKFVLHEGEFHVDHYWQIKGNTVQQVISGSVEYKAKVITENEKIYFEGYTWKDKLLSRECGSNTKYEVIYDEKTKSITLNVISDNE